MATPMLALLIACGAALILEQPRVLRTLATITAGFGVLMMVGLMVYVLDALQVRTQITAQARATFQLGFLLSLLKFGVGLAFVESFAVVAWRAATALKRSAVHHAHSRSAPPVLRRSGQAPAEPEPSPVLAGSTASDEFNSAGELIRGQPA